MSVSYYRNAKLRRGLARYRLVLGHIARTRTFGTAVQLGKAFRADITDLAAYISHRLALSLALLEKVLQASRVADGFRNITARTSKPYLFGVCLLLLAGALIWTLHDLPFAQVLKGSTERVILLETADGQPLARKGLFRAPDKSLKELPPHLIDAVISIEDKQFYTHSGIDPAAMVRALGRNIQSGGIVQGGSTITQQLAKILYLDRQRTLTRKFREIVLALWLETKLSKEEILTRYLNNVYLGAGATGVPAAALTYFGKDASDLTVPESALLAGLIVAPSYLNPRQNPEAARERSALVIDAMVANGRLDVAGATAAKNHAVRLVSKPVGLHAGTWFADWVYREAVDLAGPFQGTLRVRTTLIPTLQALAEKAVSNALARQGKANGVTQAALVAMLPDGAVVAMVGGRNYQTTEFNRAVQAMRQPGSAFKLFVYYAALRNGFSPRDQIEDGPLEIDGWSPENFGGDFRGRVSIAEAFARSLNAATVRLALEVGLDEVISAARDLGLDAPLKKIPSLALGSSEVSLLDLTGAYASVRAGVAPIEAWGISGLGTEQTQVVPVGPEVKPARSLEAHQGVLVGLLKLVVDRGTGRAAALDRFAAGKTGTSQNYRDAWFIGFTEDLVVGVWVGNDDDTPMKSMTGGKLPASIWKDFMTEAMKIAEKKPAALVGEARADASGPQCDYRACARAYRSFQPEDCSYQPYGGPRRICEK
jgi:penicillin-binding protein 1A